MPYNCHQINHTVFYQYSQKRNKYCSKKKKKLYHQKQSCDRKSQLNQRNSYGNLSACTSRVTFWRLANTMANTSIVLRYPTYYNLVFIVVDYMGNFIFKTSMISMISTCFDRS